MSLPDSFEKVLRLKHESLEELCKLLGEEVAGSVSCTLSKSTIHCNRLVVAKDTDYKPSSWRLRAIISLGQTMLYTLYKKIATKMTVESSTMNAEVITTEPTTRQVYPKISTDVIHPLIRALWIRFVTLMDLSGQDPRELLQHMFFQIIDTYSQFILDATRFWSSTKKQGFPLDMTRQMFQKLCWDPLELCLPNSFEVALLHKHKSVKAIQKMLNKEVVSKINKAYSRVSAEKEPLVTDKDNDPLMSSSLCCMVHHGRTLFQFVKDNPLSKKRLIQKEWGVWCVRSERKINHL